MAQYAGPGGWNDIDALIGTNPDTAVHLTKAQSRTQFNLWCLLSAQLIIGSSILQLNDFDTETYTNKQLIRINQDRLGHQAKLVLQHSQVSSNPLEPSIQQIWLKGPLSNQEWAIAFVNTTNASSPVPLARTERGGNTGSSALSLVTCNQTESTQLWNVSEPVGGFFSVSNTAHAATPDCIEVNACNYSPGAKVDAAFGCKKLPKPGNKDKCAANMAWKFTKQGALQAAFAPAFCVSIIGGGALVQCDGSREQSWKLEGASGRQLLRSGSGLGCLSNGASSSGVPTSLAFSVSALGWKTAVVTDLWSGKTVTTDTITVSLPEGNGASQVFRIAEGAKPSPGRERVGRGRRH